MVDQKGVEQPPLPAGEELHQVPLDLLRVVLPAQPQFLGEAADVGVHGDPRGHAEGVVEDDVRGLAGHAGEGEEILHRLGDLPAVGLLDPPGGADDVLRLVPEEAGGADLPFEDARIGPGVVGGGAVFPEEGGGDPVDHRVRGLGGEDGGDQKLQGVGVDEGHLRRRVLPPETADDLKRPFHLLGGFHGGLPEKLSNQ